jgi:hypothetical protein
VLFGAFLMLSNFYRLDSHNETRVARVAIANLQRSINVIYINIYIYIYIRMNMGSFLIKSSCLLKVHVRWFFN